MMENLENEIDFRLKLRKLYEEGGHETLLLAAKELLTGLCIIFQLMKEIDEEERKIK